MEPLGLFFAALSAIATTVAVVIAYEHRRDRRRVAKNSVNWNYSFCVAEDLRRRIKTWGPELIIGIGRSGGIWGGWMAGNLGSLPFGVVDDKYESNNVSFPGGADVLAALKRTHPSVRRVLLIEGASARGQTINEFRAKFADLMTDWDVRVAVLFVAESANADIEYCGRVGPSEWPDRMPWHQDKSWVRAMKREDAA
ncbi:MAG: hypothetical protein A49_01700 [Methyloceanibacter sp.]|nr:MAG: hypothetical protein A49_01700 [Methyloceanibacter sp.]